MRNAFIWWLRFCILGLGFTGCRTVTPSDVLLNEITEFSKKEFLENKTGGFQIPEILSLREHGELSKKNPDFLGSIRELSRSEGKKLLAEQVSARRLDRDVAELFKIQLKDPDFRRSVEAKGEGAERFTEDAKAAMVFLLLSLNQAWAEEEGVRAELRRRVSRTLRQQNYELSEVRPKS